MLDTNILSYLIKNRSFELIDKFEKVSIDNTVAISSISAAEIFYGVKKKASPKLEAAVREFLYPIDKYSFDENAAFIYGILRAELESNGNVIGSYDMLIAAHAISLDAVLVTNNTREFERVPNLKAENWV